MMQHFLVPLLQLNVPSQGRQGNGTDGSQSNAGAQGQAGNQPFGQGIPNASFQSLPQVVQIPVGAATIPLPSLYSVIDLFHFPLTIGVLIGTSFDVFTFTASPRFSEHTS